MSEKQYALQYDGTLVTGFDGDSVRRQLGRLLNLEAGVLDQLFSGRRVTLKRGLDQQQAIAYQRTIIRAGAQVRVVQTAAVSAEPSNPRPSGAAGLQQQAACPRCGFTQPRADRCGRCKMDLRRHWKCRRRP